MINTNDILETIGMIQDESLDIRTITMGISLLDIRQDLPQGRKASFHWRKHREEIRYSNCK